MIRVENLTKKFGSITAVENISFIIEKGQIFGFLGPNGAGKTTTIRMLAALIKPTNGKITIDEKDAFSEPEHIRSIIGLLTESPGMYEKISAFENLNYFSSFYNIDEIARRNNIEKFLKMFKLWERRNDAVKTFSKGMKQKLALARALVHEPKILFLDEPTAGLDPESAFMVRNFIENLRNDAKTTVFLCTHNLEEASNLSDVVCIIKSRIIKISTLEELQKNKHKGKIEAVFANDASKYSAIFKSFTEITSFQAINNKAILYIEEPGRVNPLILKKLISGGAQIIYFNEIKTSLEEIYLDLVKN